MSTRTKRLVVPPPRGSRVFRLVAWGVLLGTAGVNGWWYWDDRPSEDMRTIDGWVARGRTAEAERALRHHLRRSRYNGEARMKLARLMAGRKDYLGCARELSLVPDWWPVKGEALFLEAQAYKLIHRARDAEAAWRACTAHDPLHPVPATYFDGASRELVGNYILEDRIEEARQTLWRAYEVAPPQDRPAILVMRMSAELERIKHDEALARLKQYTAADPDDWEARRAMAAEEQWAGLQDDADRDIEVCLKDRPSDPRGWRTKLDILHKRGDRDGVRAALRKVPTSADEDADVWKFRGLASEWAGDPAAARDAFLRATKLNPYEAEYWYRLGIAERRLGRPAQAADNIRRSQRLRTAFTELQDAFYEYLKASQEAAEGKTPSRKVVERVASLCEQLGWKREAEAWRNVVPEEATG